MGHLSVGEKLLPQVLVGGFPRSGTSFLCNLVATMGFNPGSPENLKPADENNRWGYWEHLIMRGLAWSTLSVAPSFDVRCKSMREASAPGFFAETVPPDAAHPIAEILRAVAQWDGVEVYKDVALPLIYRLFPAASQYIVIQRDNLVRMYEYRKQRWAWQTFLNNLADYQHLTQEMANNVATLIVKYEAFRDDFDIELARLADFLGVNFGDIDLAHLQGIFRMEDD